MNKLLELIAEDKRQGIYYRVVPIETLEHIADLIDAARKPVDQHAASLAAVARHKGATPETDALYFPNGKSASAVLNPRFDLGLSHAKKLERQRDTLAAEVEMWRDAYYGSAPSGAKLRCRKCGDLTEINFHYAAKDKP